MSVWFDAFHKLYNYFIRDGPTENEDKKVLI